MSLGSVEPLCLGAGLAGPFGVSTRLQGNSKVVRQACPEFNRRAHHERARLLLPFVISASSVQALSVLKDP